MSSSGSRQTQWVWVPVLEISLTKYLGNWTTPGCSLMSTVHYSFCCMKQSPSLCQGRAGSGASRSISTDRGHQAEHPTAPEWALLPFAALWNTSPKPFHPFTSSCWASQPRTALSWLLWCSDIRMYNTFQGSLAALPDFAALAPAQSHGICWDGSHRGHLVQPLALHR